MQETTYTPKRVQEAAAVAAAFGIGRLADVQSADNPAMLPSVLRVQLEDGSWWDVTMTAKQIA